MASPVPAMGSKETRSKLRLQMELFSEAKAHWGAPRRQVFCQHDKDTVVLYRACCEHLGPHATDTQCFRGSPCYEKDRARMMWFDTSFLVSMRKSEWGTKKGREVVLAIWVKRSFVEDCLGTAVCSNTFGPSCGNAKCNNGEGGGGSGDNSRRSRFSASSLSAGGGRRNRSRSPGSACSSPAGSSAGSPPQSPIFSPQNRQQQPGDTRALGGGGQGAKGGGSGGGDGGAATAAATAAAALLARGRHALGREDSDFVGAGDVEEVRARALTGGALMQSDFGEGGRSSTAAEGLAGRGGDGGVIGGTASEGGALAGGVAGRRPRSKSLTWSTHNRRMTEGVRVHWEPERLPSGEKHRTRRVVQLGLKGKWLQNLGSGDAVVRIERLDPVLAAQRAALNSSKPHLLTVPVARPLDVGHLTDNQLAALHLVSERARPKLRILCLHGYLQNSQIFSRRTRQLFKKLKNTAELVYVDAPHLLSPEELPPPLPAAVSPLEEAAIAATAAAAAAAAKVVDAGEGGALDAEWVSPLSSPVTSPVFWRKTMADGSSRGAGRAGSDAGSPTKQQQQQQQQQDRVGARTWWRCDAEERKRAKAVPGMAGRCEWKGLEESLAFLTKVWDEQGPFDGLLGFSQGAAMASIFNHCVFSGGGNANACGGNCGPERDTGDGTELLGDGNAGDTEVFDRPLLPPPKFGVFISGCYQPHPTQIPSYPLTQEQPQAKLPSLHVWAIEDRFVPASQSQRLAGMYLRSAVFMHRGSHCVPQNKDIVPNFVRFLEEYR